MRTPKDWHKTVSLRTPSAETIYLAVREEYFLKNVTGQLGAFLGWYIAICRTDVRMSGMLK